MKAAPTKAATRNLARGANRNLCPHHSSLPGSTLGLQRAVQLAHMFAHADQAGGDVHSSTLWRRTYFHCDAKVSMRGSNFLARRAATARPASFFPCVSGYLMVISLVFTGRESPAVALVLSPQELAHSLADPLFLSPSPLFLFNHLQTLWNRRIYHLIYFQQVAHSLRKTGGGLL